MWTRSMKALTCMLGILLLCMMSGSFASAQSYTDWVLRTHNTGKETFLAGGNPEVQHGSADGGFLYGNGVSPSGFGTWRRSMDADEYRTKRIRLSAYVRTEDVEKWAGLWMRIDSRDRRSLAFDNMENRAIKGTTDWTRYEVVLDVPEAATLISFGTLLEGDGKVWTGSLQLDTVGQDVPVTDMRKE